MNKRDARFHYTCKMKTSSPLGSIKNRIRIEGSDKAVNLSEHHPVTPSFISSEMARVQANFKLDHVLQEMKHYTVFFCMVTNCSLLCTRISWIEIRSR